MAVSGTSAASADRYDQPRGGSEEAGRAILSVIVPTRHERRSVEELVERLGDALCAVDHEVIFVDDSDDDTPAIIDELVRAGRAGTGRLALLHRPAGERQGGLSGAVVEGMRIATGEWICVMDGDLQHPPEVVPVLVRTADDTEADLVVGTRFREGGGASGLRRGRNLVSRTAAGMARSAFPHTLRSLSDPMSGLFVVRRSAVDLDVLRPVGFKILIELAVRCGELKVVEVPYEFGARRAGTSKASARQGLDFTRHLARLRLESRAGTASHEYDIHGIIGVTSEGRLPELEPFRVTSLARRPDIRVRIGRLPKRSSGPSRSPESTFRYTERVGNLGFAADVTLGDTIEILAAPLLRRSPHVLYTNLVEPVLRWEFARRGYALAHGACIVRGDDAFMVTARTDTGKTTTMLKLLDAQPYRFVADDLTIVRPDGRVLPYPKPLTISNHTLHAVKRPLLNRWERTTLPLQSRLHSRSGRRFAFLLAKTGLPVATVNTVVQLLVPPPKYPVQRLVPGVEIAAGRQRLAGLLVIQRSGDGFEWLSDDDALEILLANCEDAYGFPPYQHLEAFLLGATPDDLRAIERGVLGGAFEQVPAALLSSTTLDWAIRIPALIEELTPARVDDPVDQAVTGSLLAAEGDAERVAR